MWLVRSEGSCAVTVLLQGSSYGPTSNGEAGSNATSKGYLFVDQIS